MTSNGRKKRRRWIWGIVLVLAVAAAGVAVKASLKPDRAIDPSRLVTIESGDIARSVVATGKIEPRVKVEVKSKASGIVKRLYFDYGDSVRHGDILAELSRAAGFLACASRNPKAVPGADWARSLRR